MNKILAVLVILLLVPLASAQSVTLSATGSTTPSEIDVGDSGTLQIVIKNQGNSDASGITMDLIQNNKLTFDQSFFDVGLIGGGESKTVNVPIRVKSPVSGTVNVIVEMDYMVDGNPRSQEISIPVGISGGVVLKITSSQYEKATPGKNIDVDLELTNLGKDEANDIQTELLVGSLPFVPVDGDLTQYVFSLRPSESKSLSYKVHINKDADIKAYSVPVNIKYEDSSGSEFNINRSIGLQIAGEADFIVTLDSNPLQGPNSDLSISIANRGNMPAEFLSMDVDSPYGSKTVYVGNLDPDDFEVVDVSQNLVGISGKYSITATINYKDSYSNELSEVVELEVEPIALPKSYTMFYVLGLVIVLLLVKFRKKIKL